MITTDCSSLPGGAPKENRASASESLLLQHEAAALLGLHPRTLEQWRHKGRGPKYIQISARCVRYRKSDVLEWITERERTSAKDDGEGHGEDLPSGRKRDGDQK